MVKFSSRQYLHPSLKFVLILISSRPIVDYLSSSGLITTGIWNLKFLELYGVVSFTILFLMFLYEMQNIYNNNTLALTLIIFILFFSIYFSTFEKFLMNFSFLAKISSNFLIFFLVGYYFKHINERILRLIYIPIFFTLLMSLLDYLHGGHQFYYGISNTIYGPFEGPHSLSYFVLMTQPFLFFLFALSKKKEKYILSILLVVNFFIIYNTHTRNGIINYIIQIFLFLFLTKNYKYLLVSIAATIIFVIMNFNIFYTRFYDVTDLFQSSYVKYDALSSRGEIWSLFYGYFVELPFLQHIIGHGFDFIAVLNHLPHNDYLFIFIGFGLVGLLFFTLVFIKIIKASKFLLKQNEIKYKQLGLCGLIISIDLLIIATNVNVVSAVNSQWYFWCFAGIVYAKYKLLSRKESII